MFFITLTYDKKHLPQHHGHMTLCKKDFQDFMKRLRYHTGEKLLYFACGEYGDTTYRPHYHAIIFNYKPEDLKEIGMSKTDNSIFTSPTLEKIWGNGYVAVQEANYKSACYTARYVQKKAGIKPQKRFVLPFDGEIEEKIDERTKKPFIYWKTKYKTEKYDLHGREKEFILMSKKPALGKTYWETHQEEIKLNGGIFVNIDGKPKLKPIPRYFKKLWEKKDVWDFVFGNFKITQRAIKNHELMLSKITDKDPEKKLLEYQKSALENRAKWLVRDEI